MAKRTLHAAFGHIIARNEFVKSETLVVDTTAAVRSHIFYTCGRFVWTNVVTGEIANECNAGLFIPGGAALHGVFKGEALDNGSVFYCLDPKINRDYLPEVHPVVITSSETLSAKTKLFLCSGTVQVKNQTISAPAQIKLESGAEVISVGGTAYGFLF